MSQIIFRLKTAVKTVGIAEPTTIMPDIAEPVKWSDVPLVGEVDPKYHGFNYNYSEGDLKLDFTCESAHQLLSSQYYDYGTDAIVEFMVIEVGRDGEEFIDYDGKIDFSTIDIQPGRVSVSIVTNDDHTKVSSRWESPIALDSVLTLDNVAIAPTDSTIIPFQGQTLHEVGEFHKLEKYTESKTFTDGVDLGGAFFLLPKMYFPASGATTPAVSTASIPALDTLKGVSYLYGDVTPLNVIEPPDLLLVDETTAGTYHIEIDWLFTVNVSIQNTGSNFLYKSQFSILTFRPVVVIIKPGQDKIVIPLCEPKSGNGFINSVEHSFIGKYYVDTVFPAGTQLKVFTEIVAFSVHQLKRMEFYVETVNLRILIDRKTRAAPTRAQAYLLPDALRHVMGAITSNVNSSTQTGNIYGGLIDKAHSGQMLDGYATEYAVTTGNLLRGLSKVPTFTLKELMGTLWSQHAAGMLYEKDPETGVQSIRIEEGAWFCRGGEIAVIETVFEYSEVPDVEQLFNQINVGYEKFPDSGAGVAEEFNTVHTYQTPLVNRDAKLEILCPLIAAGTAIEEARRLGIKKTVDGVEVSTTTEAGTYDDDGFILHVLPFGHQDTFTFIIEEPTLMKPYTAHYIQFTNAVIHPNPGGVLLFYGDKITISGTGTANDGVVYKVVGIHLGVTDFSLTPTYEVENVASMTAAGPVAGSWQIGNQSVKLRANERLDMTGVTDPETVINLELSPARMLRRWALFINSGLAYKQAIDELKCTAYKQNGNVTSRVRTGVSPLPGDSDKQLIRETGNIALGSLEHFNKLFRPDLIRAKVRISREVRRAIFSALKNKGDDDKRMGYLTIRNPDKKLVSGYLRSISYKDSSEVADIILRKRRDDDDPDAVDCSFYYDWIYNQFPGNPLANPNIYRFCHFNDFQPA